MEHNLSELGFSPDQIRRWKDGELLIEFSIDSPPEVNPQDFEKWVQTTNFKLAKKYQTYPDWPNPPVGHCIK